MLAANSPSVSAHTYRCDISTAGQNFPGVSKVWGVHLQLVVAAYQIIVDVSIKVTTQATHPALHTKEVFDIEYCLKMRQIVGVVTKPVQQ